MEPGEIGDAIHTRQETVGWGAQVIDQLAADLRAEFPAMTGLSRRNLYYMRAFAEAWPDPRIVQSPSARLPWGHITLLLDKLNDPAARAAPASNRKPARLQCRARLTARLAHRCGPRPRSSAPPCETAGRESPSGGVKVRRGR